MQLFFFDAQQQAGDRCVLNEEESYHCAKVLRMQPGETIGLLDGAGGIYEAQLITNDSRGCVVQILRRETRPARSGKLHIAIAPTKNIDRFEFFLEKATEIGIDEITPLICARSERKEVKTMKLRKQLLSAMKQSVNPWLPVLHEPVSYRTFVETYNAIPQKFIAHAGQEEAEGVHLKDVLVPDKDALVLVGPEGDFSPDELALAAQKGYRQVSLGAHRLRTETAGIVACHTVALRK